MKKKQLKKISDGLMDDLAKLHDNHIELTAEYNILKLNNGKLENCIKEMHQEKKLLEGKILVLQGRDNSVVESHLRKQCQYWKKLFNKTNRRVETSIGNKIMSEETIKALTNLNEEKNKNIEQLKFELNKQRDNIKLLDSIISEQRKILEDNGLLGPDSFDENEITVIVERNITPIWKVDPEAATYIDKSNFDHDLKSDKQH